MQLQDWEIWHTYSSFFDRQFEDLSAAGERLVESGLARAVVLSSGECYWQDEEKTFEGQVRVAFDRRSKSALVTIDSFDEPPRLARKDLINAGHFRYAETLLHGSEGLFPHPYLRAYLPPCVLYSEARIVELHPVVKLYSTGVILVELPQVASEPSVSLRDFIASHANLFAWKFEHIFVPPTISELAPPATRGGELNEMAFADRVRWVAEHPDFVEGVEEATERLEGHDYDVALAPLSQSPLQYGQETLSVLARTVMGVVGYLASLPKPDWRFVLEGHSNLAGLGGLWLGRPHIHLLRFSDQRGLAALNEAFHSKGFTQILAREPAAGKYNLLPPDSVPHENFSAYVGRESTLWVWSVKGLQASRRWIDSYHGHVVYENQVQCEMLDYGFMLQNRYVDLAAGHGTSDEALRAREDAVKLRRQLLHASAYSQVQGLLEDGWQRMGIDAVRGVAEEALKVSEARTSLAENLRLRRIGLLLTAIFGLAASPSLASAVIKPLWTLSAVPLPDHQSVRSLALFAVTVMILTAFILLLWVLLVNQGSEKEGSTLEHD